MADEAPEAAVFVKEMGISHEDFFRILPRALGTDDYRVSGTDVLMESAGGRRFEISLGPQGKRTIALLNLPVTMVTIRLINYGDDGAAALERFDLYFRRGGG